MKNLKLVLIVTIGFFPFFWLGAKQVSPETAKKVAETQVNSHGQLRSAQEFNLVFTKTTANKAGNASVNASSSAPADVLYYVFNAGESGFVVVAGDDVAKPVLGYSDAGAYDPDNLSPDFVYYLDDCLANEIKQAIAQGITQSDITKKQWEDYLSGNVAVLRAETAVSPILTTLWDQTSPYSDLCPNKVYTGCAATAMAQIMKHHNWPKTRTVTIPNYTTTTNAWSVGPFSGVIYDWDNMADSYYTSSSDVSKTAVATLMRDCGASAFMDYTSGGSGAYTNDIGTALLNYFNYDPSIRYEQRGYYSDPDWEALLKTELDAGRPIFYAGSNPTSGHAFVCDGYDDNGMFHFNWGWSGIYNGYFVTSSLNPGTGGAGAGAGTYNQNQEILMNIIPNNGGEKNSNIKVNARTNISTPTTTLDRGQSFTVNAPVINMGIFTFTGSAGIAIVDESDNIISVIGQRSISGLETGYYFMSPYNINCTIPVSTTPGSCRIRVVYKSADASRWSIATGSPGYADYIDLTITTNTPRTNGIMVYTDANGGLKSSATAVNRGESFTVNATFYNGGTESMTSGDYGVALVDGNDQILEVIGTYHTSTALPSGNAFANPFNFTCEVSSAITPGNYKIRAVCKPAGQDWSIVYQQSSSVIDILNLTVNSGIIQDKSNIMMESDFMDSGFSVISNPSVNQFSALTVTVYLNNASTATTPFVGKMELGLYNSAGILQEVIESVTVTLPNTGQVYSIAFNSNSINSPAGTYYMRLYQTSADGVKKIVNNNGNYFNNNLQFKVIGIPPQVSAVSPANGATDIPIDGQLVITFDKPMNTASGIGIVTLGGGTVNNAYKTWSPNGEVCTIPYAGLEYNTSYTFNISGFMDTYGNTMDAITSGYSFTTAGIPPAAVITWLGNSTVWSETSNWHPGRIPTALDTVFIPGDAANFPDLQSGDNATIAAIRFAPGAQIGHQSLLTYDKAFIQYDFSESKRNVWNMLSMPLGEAFPGDFVFGGYPLTWIRTFTSSTSGSVTQGAWSAAIGSKDRFTPGDGFVIWLNADGGTNDDPNKGLKLLKDTLELPYFENFETGSANYSTYNKIDLAQDYTPGGDSPTIGTTTFYNYSVDGSTGAYKRNNADHYDITRTSDAYRLVKEAVSKTIDFGEGVFALTGNPYMATLDFGAFQQVNPSIKENYYIWTGNGYTIFTPEGATGATVDNTLEQYIAPLQGFIVEKQDQSVQSAPGYNIARTATPPGGGDDAGGGTGTPPITLSFSENMTAIQKKAVLRSSVNEGNKLNIIARNPVAGFSAFIAKREGGQDGFGNLDARKIINSITDVPEIYTLKSYKNGTIGVGANIINNDDLLIPLDLATSYTGEIKLSFSGMDSYDADITFFDLVTNKEIELTGLASCDYSFNYTPEQVNGTTAVCENRFFIRLSSKVMTGLQQPAVEKVNVFESNGHIQVVAGTSNPIKDVMVFDPQGAMIYKKSSIHAISFMVDRNLPVGAYIVKVISEKNTDNVKVMVK